VQTGRSLSVGAGQGWRALPRLLAAGDGVHEPAGVDVGSQRKCRSSCLAYSGYSMLRRISTAIELLERWSDSFMCRTNEIFLPRPPVRGAASENQPGYQSAFYVDLERPCYERRL
jgi:hypothetical protein